MKNIVTSSGERKNITLLTRLSIERILTAVYEIR